MIIQPLCSISTKFFSGGTTGTNWMLYVCGNDRDYDGWAALGNPGWDYQSILPYIKESEGNTNKTTVGDGTYHGTKGPLTVSNYKDLDPFTSAIQDAYQQIGFPPTPDYNSRQYVGFFKVQVTTRGGERCSSYRAFIAPVKRRTNLKIMKNSLVTKVLFNGTKAIGVNVQTNDASCRNIQLRATKEVILSAGGLSSPKILLQSGIGRKEDLESFQIPQLVDSAVGYNLQDHVFSFIYIAVKPDLCNNTFLDKVYQSQLYYLRRQGQLTQFGITNCNGFVNTLNKTAKYPDIQQFFNRIPKGTARSKFFGGFTDFFLDQIYKASENTDLILVFNTLLNPLSKGTLKLASRDPTVNPSVTSGYFSEPKDIDTIVRGINTIQELIESPAMKNVSASFLKFDIPECNQISFPSDDYWKCYIKYLTASEWHFGGTCKMGPDTDSEAVVDPTLKVRGVEHLRVADASIMPTVPSGNTQCPVYAIGQKAADMIKNEWA